VGSRHGTRRRAHREGVVWAPTGPGSIARGVLPLENQGRAMIPPRGGRRTSHWCSTRTADPAGAGFIRCRTPGAKSPWRWTLAPSGPGQPQPVSAGRGRGNAIDCTPPRAGPINSRPALHSLRRVYDRALDLACPSPRTGRTRRQHALTGRQRARYQSRLPPRRTTGPPPGRAVARVRVEWLGSSTLPRSEAYQNPRPRGGRHRTQRSHRAQRRA
jgi:hypothetical protein